MYKEKGGENTANQNKGRKYWYQKYHRQIILRADWNRF
jgi:hypothetical protein